MGKLMWRKFSVRHYFSVARACAIPAAAALGVSFSAMNQRCAGRSLHKDT
jgi:hypothetical protein